MQLADVTVGGELPPDLLRSQERIADAAYDSSSKTQKLTVRGVLSDEETAEIMGRLDGKLATEQRSTLDDLLKGTQKLVREFFDNHLKIQRLRNGVQAGFLEDCDFNELFLSSKTVNERHYRIAKAYLPGLQERLIRQFLIQSLTARTGADPLLVESLLSDERVLVAPQAKGVNSPLIAALAPTVVRGVNATFRVSQDGAGPVLGMVELADADTAGVKDESGKLLIQKGARTGHLDEPEEIEVDTLVPNSARLDAYVQVPATGPYQFYVEIDGQENPTRVQLSFQDLPEPVLSDETRSADTMLELKAGVLHRFSLDLKGFTGDVRMMVQGENLPKGPLAQLVLYPAAAIDAAEQALTLLGKALQLLQGLGLSERETRYILTHKDDFGNLSLSGLPTAKVTDEDANKVAGTGAFGHFRRLAAYTRLKRDLAFGTDDLIAIFEANGTKAGDRLDNSVYPLIAKLTRRETATVSATAKAIFLKPNFSNEKSLSRLWEALQVVERIGVQPELLRTCADIVGPKNAGGREIANRFRDALKARLGLESWQRVAQPIFDKLRKRKRDALVGYVLQQLGYKTMEELYEHFLIDPGMEPVVQTSRIRLAISSLQLFVQRSLLNLEKNVRPNAINAKQWEWMKRYRVWEANRKIFLFPENWLEPEFRDDKTHLFTELEGALLQGDVSSDLVEDAFLTYLRKLDEMARLDICAMHIEETGELSARTLHVFGRTASQPHKYFYRRYADAMWTPWEPVSAQIEGDHLAPVIWRNRLYLFWVTFMEKPSKRSDVTEIDPTKVIPISGVAIDVEAQLQWSEYLNGEWSTRESGEFNSQNPVIVRNLSHFDRQSVSIHVSKEYDSDDNELGVFIHLGGTFLRAFHLAGRNGAPEPSIYKGRPAIPFTSASREIGNRYSGSGSLIVSYHEGLASQVDIWANKINRLVLQKGIGTGESYTILPCDNGEAAMQNLHHAVKQFGYEAGGWRVENHPRFLADLTGDGRLDIVGFAKNGVLVSLNNGDGTFREPEVVLEAFGWDHGWRVEKHPRFLADLTGDGRADIIGFFDDGVWVAFNNGDGGFNKPKLVLSKFWDIAESYFATLKNGFEAVFLADLTDNGRPDIVFFDRTGVWVALNQVGLEDKPFSLAKRQLNLGRFAAGQSADIETMRDLCFLVDLTGDGCADIVAFGADGVWVALSNRDGTFTALERKLETFGDNLEVGGCSADKHPRFLADVTGNGRPDIVGFGDAGVYVALNNGDGTFQSEKLVSSAFGHLPAAGNWLVENHPRFLADVTGDGRADIVGFANSGVVVALNKGDGTFQEPRLVLSAFGHDENAGGWDVKCHPRFLADLSGDGRSDIVGFANDGVWVGTLYGAFGSSLTEIASLGRPVFYQDKRHVFFVEPTLAEPTADEWEGWVPSPGRPEAPSVDAGSIEIIPEISAIDPKAPIWNPPVIDKESILQRGHTFDWIVNHLNPCCLQRVPAPRAPAHDFSAA